MPKKAVLLLNLGSPASTKVSDVRAYLKEFLLDERVIDSPTLIRNCVVRGLILPTRPANSAEAYEKVWTPDGSPLLVTSFEQQKLLQEKASVPIYIAMRYGDPSIECTFSEIVKDGIDELFIMPLYPHYAMSSYETVVVKVRETLAEKCPAMKYTLLQPFYQDEDYIEAMIENAKPWLEQTYDHILFSFHGIPERHLRKSDPSHDHCLSRADCCETTHPCHATCYRHQCFETTRAIVNKAEIPTEKFSISFQSRLGRDPWLKPYTDFVLKELPDKGVKRLLVMCPAFITDCLETLEEISMTGKEDFLAAGGDTFAQIPCLNTHPAWINVLAKRVEDWAEQD